MWDPRNYAPKRGSRNFLKTNAVRFYGGDPWLNDELQGISFKERASHDGTST
ncbi:hypothetical protein ART_2136 [Arthrobacter sp. PAMC 25486]|nr:hypothetical protein ART_2136 [Arthrobacter sp. PAMC 25486]